MVTYTDSDDLTSGMSIRRPPRNISGEAINESSHDYAWARSLGGQRNSVIPSTMKLVKATKQGLTDTRPSVRHVGKKPGRPKANFNLKLRRHALTNCNEWAMEEAKGNKSSFTFTDAFTGETITKTQKDRVPFVGETSISIGGVEQAKHAKSLQTTDPERSAFLISDLPRTLQTLRTAYCEPDAAPHTVYSDDGTATQVITTRDGNDATLVKMEELNESRYGENIDDKITTVLSKIEDLRQQGITNVEIVGHGNWLVEFAKTIQETAGDKRLFGDWDDFFENVEARTYEFNMPEIHRRSSDTSRANTPCSSDSSGSVIYTPESSDDEGSGDRDYFSRPLRQPSSTDSRQYTPYSSNESGSGVQTPTTYSNDRSNSYSDQSRARTASAYTNPSYGGTATWPGAASQSTQGRRQRKSTTAWTDLLPGMAPGDKDLLNLDALTEEEVMEWQRLTEMVSRNLSYYGTDY